LNNTAESRDMEAKGVKGCILEEKMVLYHVKVGRGEEDARHILLKISETKN
jgi:hypothetical protein